MCVCRSDREKLYAWERVYSYLHESVRVCESDCESVSKTASVRSPFENLLGVFADVPDSNIHFGLTSDNVKFGYITFNLQSRII